MYDSLYANSRQNDIYPYNKNVSLKAYFAKARRCSGRHNGGSRSSSDAALSFTTESCSEKAAQAEPGTIALANGSKYDKLYDGCNWTKVTELLNTKTLPFTTFNREQ